MSIFDSIADAFETVGNAVVSGATTVGNAVVSGVTTVGNTVNTGLTDVVEGLDPQLQSLKGDYANLTAEYRGLQAQIPVEMTRFTGMNDTYKNYAGLMGALLLNYSFMGYDDARFNDFLKQTETPPPGIDQNSALLSARTVAFIKSTYGDIGPNLVNGTYDFAQLQQQGFVGLTGVAIAPSDIVADILGMVNLASIIGSGASNLLTGAMGAVVSLSPTQCVLNVINDTSAYSNANNQLRADIGQMNGSIAQMKDAEGRLQQGIADLRRSFVQLASRLNGIVPARCTWNLAPDATDAAYLTALAAISQQYAIISQLRSAWANYKTRQPQGTIASFRQVAVDTLAGQYSAADIGAFLDLMAQYTPGMRPAVAAAAR